MSYIYSQALVAAFLEDNSSGIEQFAPLKSSLTQDPFLWHDKTMVLSLRSQFGMMCEPLTDDLGAALLTWFVEDSLARTLARQEKAQESPESEADCGASSLVSLERHDPDTHSLKTAQCSSGKDSKKFSLTLPRSGMMRDGGVCPLPKLALRKNAPESGSLRKWPTPTARAAGDCPSERRRHQPSLTAAVNIAEGTVGGKLNPEWEEWLMGWIIGMTDLRPLAMDKCLWQRQQLFLL